ncbi:MAG: HYR domain-containing protein [Bacteroidia bacterium]|nr:HYR domain-containing protein [Bacteroidia bacterium]
MKQTYRTASDGMKKCLLICLPRITKRLLVSLLFILMSLFGNFAYSQGCSPDVTAPTFTCNNHTVALDASGVYDLEPDVFGTIITGLTDNCPGTLTATLFVLNSFILNCNQVGTLNLQVNVRDEAGNTSPNCSFSLTIQDNMPPMAVCQDITTFLNAGGSSTITANDVDGGSTDNCSILSRSIDISTFDCSQKNTTVNVTLTVNDPSGNSDMCTAMVSVSDTIPVKAVCSAIPDVQLDENGEGLLPQNIATGSSFDNCKVVSEFSPAEAVDCDSIGSNTVKLYASDANGIDSALCKYNVRDTFPPEAICPPQDTVYLDNSGEAFIPANAAAGDSSIDNCAINESSPDSTFDCSFADSEVLIPLFVSDNDGNSDTTQCSFIIKDTTAPEAICPPLPTLELNDTGYAFLAENAAAGGLSTDNCGSPSETSPADTFICADTGVQQVILTATDASGNTSMDTCEFRVEDNQRPQITCPRDTTLFAENGICEALIEGLIATATDNCEFRIDNNSSYALADSNDASGIYPVGVTFVKFRATDASGNRDSCQTRIQVIDDQVPFVFCIQNVGAPIDPATGLVVVPPNAVISKATDNCFVDSVHMSRDSFYCDDLGLVNITVTVFDSTGNFNSCNTQIDVQDKFAPITICRDTTVYLDLNGEVMIDGSFVDSGSHDICGIDTLIVDPSKFDCSNVGENMVVLTAFDPAGNSDTCHAIVTVKDTIAPTAICKNITLFQPDTGGIKLTPMMIDNGSNDECGIDSMDLHVDTLTCKGDYPIILTVFDPSGNSDQCKGIVTVEDTVKPIALCKSDTISLGNGGVTLSPDSFDDGSFDQCGLFLKVIPDTFTCADTGLHKLLFIAEDAVGNKDSCLTSVYIIDDEAPTAVCFNTIELHLDSNGEFSITPDLLDSASTDNCGIAVYTTSKTKFNCKLNQSKLITHISGDKILPVELVVQDSSGNTDTCITNIIIRDTFDLKVTCPADIVVDVDSGLCSAVVEYVISVEDNCFMTLTQTSGDTSGAAFPCGTDSITFVAVDACGATDTCSFKITVEDNEPPVITCPTDTVIFLSEDSCRIRFFYPVTTSDNCPDRTPVFFTETGLESGSLFELDTTYVMITTVDKASNRDTCEFNVIVRDTFPPEISCSDFDIYLDTAGSAILCPSDLPYILSDNCMAYVIEDCDTLDCSDLGPYSFTLIATDGSGNVDSCEFDIEVKDTLAPIITCRDTTIYIDHAGFDFIQFSSLVRGDDNCSYVISPVQTLYNCGFLGQTVSKVITATDPSLNVDTCTAKITIADTTAPLITCKNIDVFLEEDGSATIDSADVVNSIFEVCEVSVSLSQQKFNCDDIGLDTITVTATDISGNADSCFSIITIIDTIPPVARCHDSLSVILNAGKIVKLPTSFFDNGSSDTCSDVTLSLDQFLFDCDDVGFNTVTLTATDASGNSSTCESILEVKELTKPAALCKSLVNAPLDANGDVIITKELIDDGSFDNCDSLQFSFDVTKIHCASNVVTMTVTDMSGNMAMCTAKVVTKDTTAPTALCKSINLHLQPSGIEKISIADIDSGSWDGCGIASIALSQTIFNCNDLGLQSETLTVTDNSGNVGICKFTVNVADPSGKCPLPCPVPNNLVCTNIGVNSATVSWDPVPGASSYVVQGCKLGEAMAYFGSANTSFTASGLQHSSEYEWQVTAVCAGQQFSALSPADTFCTDSCNAPTDLHASNISTKSVTLNWTQADNAIKYYIKGKPIGGGYSATTISGSKSSLYVNGLIEGATYIWAMTSICDESPFAKSKLSEVDTFNMISNSKTIQQNNIASDITVDVYPNPMNGEFYISVENTASFNVKVYDMIQHEIYSTELDNSFGMEHKIDISDQPAGVYIIEIVSGEFKMIQKVIKE